MKFKELKIETCEPSPKDFEKISNGLIENHKSNGKIRNPQKFSIFLRTEDNNVFGGFIGTTFWSRMYINSLWVDETLRGQGWGRKLMELAEQEALNRGCLASHTDTFSWQSPEFYKKIGYEVIGELNDYPPGDCLYYLNKNLKAK